MDLKKLDQIKTPEEWLKPLLSMEQRKNNVPEYDVEEETKHKEKKGKIFLIKKQHESGMRVAAAAVVCILVFGTGITVAAASGAFRTWLVQVFGGQEVSEELYGVSDENGPDIKADENALLAFGDNIQIWGNKESFVYKYHLEGEDKVVDQVSMVQGNGLKKLSISFFQGEYDGVPFSFEYAMINQEICAFNYQGALEQIFHYVDGDKVYAVLWYEDDQIEKSCIAALNLKTGEVAELSDDDMVCNFVMSPNGKTILCNYRAEGYWTVFDIAAGTEKKVKGINGYAHVDEIKFLDDYHILTLGEPFMKANEECYSTYSIDLRTRKITDEYKDNGNINMEWSYRLDKNGLKIYRITNEDSFCIENAADNIHPITVRGDYVLFGNLEEEDAAFYLVHLKNQSFMKIDMPKELHSDVEMYLAAKEKKLLLTNGREAYLADVSTL